MLRLGGGGREPEIPYIYALSWKGNVVKFDAVGHSEGSKEKGWVVDWYVSNVRIPPQLESQRDEVLALLTEGLDAMGNIICIRDNINAVKIHFQEFRITEPGPNTLSGKFSRLFHKLLK